MDFFLQILLPKHFLLIIGVGIGIAIIAPLQAAPIESVSHHEAGYHFYPFEYGELM